MSQDPVLKESSDSDPNKLPPINHNRNATYGQSFNLNSFNEPAEEHLCSDGTNMPPFQNLGTINVDEEAVIKQEGTYADEEQNDDEQTPLSHREDKGIDYEDKQYSKNISQREELLSKNSVPRI